MSGDPTPIETVLPSAATIQDIWPLTGVSIKARYSSFPTRVVGRLHTDQGDFAIKADSNPNVPWNDDLYVLDYLADRNFPHAPGLVRTRGGERVARLETATACVLEYIPYKADEALGSAFAWSRLGEVSALLNAHRDFPVSYTVPVPTALRDLSTRVEGWSLAPEYRTVLRRVGRLAEVPADRLIHGEINCANTARRKDGTVVLLDWDQAGSGPAPLEYGYPLIHIFVSVEDHQLDEPSAEAFYTAYRACGGVVEPNLAFDAALFHACRYMWFGGEVERRWERIAHALRHEDDIRDVTR